MKTIRLFKPYSFLPTVVAALGLALGGGSVRAATSTFSTAGTEDWICPPGITSVKVECWGAGGAGGAARCATTGSTSAGGGGGGGAYIVAEVSVTPGATYTVTVGAGGTSLAGVSTAGGASSINTTVPVSANGGASGVSVTANATYGNGGAGGAGGTYAGGNGAKGAAGGSGKGGGGGGSAGTGSAGNYTVATTIANNFGATAVTGGGAGGNGAGSGGSAVTGSGGSFPGGGGGGAAAASTTTRSGGAGARGQVVLTYFPSYYSQGSLDATLTASWNSDPAGGGTSPTNFTSGDVFIIQNGHSMTTSTSWTISGTEAGLRIQNGGTLTATSVVDAPTLQVDSGGTYAHNTTGNNLTSDFPGSSTRTLDANSTVTFLTWGSAPIPALAYGNLTLDYASGVTLGGNTAVRGLLTLTSGALSIGANTLTLNGTVTATGGSLTGGDTSMITCGGSSAITLPAVAGGLNKLTVNNAGGVVLGGAISLGGTSPALVMTAGAVTGGGNLTLGAGTTITRTAGTLDVAPTFSGLVNVIYNGTATTQTTGPELPTSASELNNLTVNLTTGKTLNLATSATVNGTLTISGGTLNMGSSSITGGTMAVTGNSTLALGSGSLSFTNSSAVPWAGTLTLKVRLGATTLRFGTDASGLDPAQLALILVSGASAVTITDQGYIQATFAPNLLYFDNFDGLNGTYLHNTTPDVTTGAAKWVAMKGGTTGSVYAEGTLDVSSGTSTTRGGSATLAFTPQNGYVYTLDLSARNLDSGASHSTADRLYFGFAKGQSSVNGSANRLFVTDATVQGQVTEGYMTKPAYTGAAGIANRTYNDTASAEWLALTTAYGGNIDMRIVLDTSDANWTATWYAKLTSTSVYSVTRATETVTDTDITSVGFGLGQDTSGRISSFSLSAIASGSPYDTWATLNGAGPNLDDDHDNDGVSNGVEYFIGGPTGNTTGFTALPAVVNTGGTLSITWTKAASYTGTYGTDFWVETSATLAAGSWVTETSGVNVTFPSATEVKYTFPAGTMNFARLKVTGP